MDVNKPIQKQLEVEAQPPGCLRKLGGFQRTKGPGSSDVSPGGPEVVAFDPRAKDTGKESQPPSEQGWMSAGTGEGPLEWRPETEHI